MLGLKQKTVALFPHETKWEENAKATITKLKEILGDAICDIQHVGSTSIPTIMAKPIIDIAVGVTCYEDIMAYKEKLKENGFYYRPKDNGINQRLFACGSYYDGSGDIQTHFIHVVIYGSDEWNGYTYFRDYLIAHPDTAKEYEQLKIHLANTLTGDDARNRYVESKADFISKVIKTAVKQKEKEMNVKEMSQTERIILMEKIFDDSNDAVNCLLQSAEKYLNVIDRLKTLEEYYQSPDWLKDYSDDENGKIQKELKRGVLSQDGVWDMLTNKDRALKMLKEILKKEEQ